MLSFTDFKFHEVKNIYILFTLGYPLSVIRFGKEKILNEHFLENKINDVKNILLTGV